MVPAPGRASRLSEIERLLRQRRLDGTLAHVHAARQRGEGRAPFDVPALDAALDGGLPRGEISELVGPRSSGRTSLLWAWLGAATRRGELAALVDAFDRADPESAAAFGVRLDRLLWVRGQPLTCTAGAVDPVWQPGVRAVEGPGTLLERAIDRALKALALVLQAGVCQAAALDLADAPLAALRRLPAATWRRLQRMMAGGRATCLLLAPVPLARSADGVSLRASGQARWAGAHDRARRVAGFTVAVRAVSARQERRVEVAM